MMRTIPVPSALYTCDNWSQWNLSSGFVDKGLSAYKQWRTADQLPAHDNAQGTVRQARDCTDRTYPEKQSLNIQMPSSMQARHCLKSSPDAEQWSVYETLTCRGDYRINYRTSSIVPGRTPRVIFINGRYIDSLRISSVELLWIPCSARSPHRLI